MDSLRLWQLLDGPACGVQECGEPQKEEKVCIFVDGEADGTLGVLMFGRKTGRCHWADMVV